MDMDKVNLVIGVVESALNDPAKPWHGPFGWAETRTGIGRFKLLLLAVGAMACALTLRSALLSNAIAFAYPAWATVTWLEATAAAPPRSGVEVAATARAAVKWLTYWTVLAAVLVAERPLAALLGLMPFYQTARTLFFVWCATSIKNNGSAMVYDKLIKPYLGQAIGRRSTARGGYD